MMQDWLESVKAGDEVLVDGGGWPSGSTIVRVARLTPTQIVVTSGTRFNRRSGYQVGADSYRRSYLSQVTDEARTRIRLAHPSQHAPIRSVDGRARPGRGRDVRMLGEVAEGE